MRLLVTTFRFPTDLCTGDKTTLHHMLKFLAPRHEITFVSLNATEVDESEMDLVKPYCSRVEVVRLPKRQSLVNCATGLLSRTPLQARYFQSKEMHERIAKVIREERIELAYGYHLRSAQYLAGIKGCPRILDLKPVQTLNLRRMRDHVSNPLRKAVYKTEFRRVHRYESRITREMDMCLVISETDRNELDPHHQQTNFRINPHGLDTTFFAPSPETKPDPGTLIFSGNMNYDPNVDAITWFCSEVYPLIKQQHAGVKLRIAGKNPQPKVLALAEDPSITVTGFVDDIRTETRRAQVAVAPMRIAAGLQNKVLEAMAVGLPTVMTPIANEGIGATDVEQVVVAQSPRDFADNVVRLLNYADERERLSAAARGFIERSWSWEAHFEDFERRMHELCDAHSEAEPTSANDIAFANAAADKIAAGT